MKKARLRDDETTVLLVPTDEMNATFEHVVNPVLHVDTDGHILTANPSAAGWLGTTPDKMVGQLLDSWITKDTLQGLVASATDENPDPVAVPVQVLDGTREIRGAWARRVCDGRAIRILLATESDPVRIQGEAALGALGAEVGHELNNHLLVLGGYAQLLPLHLEHGQWGKARSDARMILAEVERARDLTEGLVQTAPRTDALPICDISECIRSTVAFLQPLNRFDGVEFHVELHSNPSFAGVPRNVVHQWLLNVLCTCADVLANATSPEVTIRTSPKTNWAARITIERNETREIHAADSLRESATRLLVDRSGLKWRTYPSDEGLRARRNDLCVPNPNSATARLLEVTLPTSR